jgi:HPt (histidine-containing phosphotransfer) domain-containing protein
VVDPSVLAALTSRLGERAGPMLDRLLDTWGAETDRRLADLDTALAAGDGAAVAQVAHAVRGGSAALGAAELADVCGEVETALRAGGQVDLAAAAGRIRAAAGRARDGLAQLRVGSSG